MKSQRELFTDPENVKEAIEHYSRLIEESGLVTDYFLRRCFLYFALEDYLQALDDIDLIIKKVPENPLYYCLRGLIKGKLGDPEEAWEDFETASVMNPQFAHAFLGKAVFELSEEDDILAGMEIDNFIESDPKNPRGHLYRGVIKFFSGEYAESVKELKEAGRAAKLWDPLLKKLMGRAFLKDGMEAVKNEKFGKAVIDFFQLIDCEPDNPDGHFHLGGAYMNLEEWEDARSCFEKAVELGQGKKVEQDALEMLEILDDIENGGSDEDEDDEEYEDDEYDEDEDEEYEDDADEVEEDEEEEEEEYDQHRRR